MLQGEIYLNNNNCLLILLVYTEGYEMRIDARLRHNKAMSNKLRMRELRN